MITEASTTDKQRIPIQLLGQSGCKMSFSSATIYLDPYLSNSVQELEAPDLDRLLPVPIPPNEVTDADWVLITHTHIDHCDPHTLPDIAKASPQCQFIGPAPVLKTLETWGIETARLKLSHGSWKTLTTELRIHAVPAAHPEITRDKKGRLSAVGYLLEYAEKRIYLAGDTAVTQELIDYLMAHSPIDSAFLPVNERNFFRDRRNIIGNMSIREAFLLAEETNIRKVIPVHWDMFAENAVYPEEIKAVYRGMAPSFELILDPSYI